jgi:hypothetical protein
MKPYVIRRYSVDAVFADRSRVSLRDFHFALHAAAYASRIKDMDLYPGRPYRIEIVPFEVTPQDAEHFRKTR